MNLGLKYSLGMLFNYVDVFDVLVVGRGTSYRFLLLTMSLFPLVYFFRPVVLFAATVGFFSSSDFSPDVALSL